MTEMSDPRPQTNSPAYFSLKVSRGVRKDFAMWQTAVGPMFDLTLSDPADAASFAMETTGYFLPGMAITTTSSSACRFERSRALIAKSGVENILLQVYLEGGYGLDAQGLRRDVRSGDIVALDLRQEIVIEAAAYTNVALTVERDIIAPMIVDMECLHGAIIRKGEPRNNLLRSHLQMLLAEAAQIEATEQHAVVRGTAALMAACLAPSLPSSKAAPRGEHPSMIQTIRRAIDHRLSDAALNPDRLARDFGLSRASLYRLFEPLGGVRSYIQQRRLMRAYQLITDPSRFDEPIGLVARQVGLTGNFAFSRAFRKLYAITPSDLRAAAQSGSASLQADPRAGATSFGRLNRWLLGLDANGS